MQQHDTRSIVIFAALVCGVCSVLVSGSAVALKPLQERNAVLDRQKKVLTVAGLMDPGEKLSAEQVAERFSTVEPIVVSLQTGEVVEGIDPKQFNQAKAAKDPERSRPAPENDAGVARVPENGLVYEVLEDGKVRSLIFPIEGKGLWSTLYGFIALAPDLQEIRGITFYQHGETPGLGGEVDNPRWKSLWVGRKAFDENWDPTIEVIKGSAGPPSKDPYSVDGLSGATITSRGVTHLVQFWLGEPGFGPFLERYRAQNGIS